MNRWVVDVSVVPSLLVEAYTLPALGIMTAIMMGGFALLASRIESLGARIDGVDGKLTARIDALDEKQTARADGLEQKLTARIDALEERLDRRIDKLDARFAGFEVRFDTLEDRLTARIDVVAGRVDELNHHVNELVLAVTAARPRRANG